MDTSENINHMLSAPDEQIQILIDRISQLENKLNDKNEDNNNMKQRITQLELKLNESKNDLKSQKIEKAKRRSESYDKFDMYYKKH